MEDYEKVLSKGILAMVSASLQVLTVSSKGEVLVETAETRLGLTQGPPTPILFIEYINNLPRYCRSGVDHEVQPQTKGSTEISLTADDVKLHTMDWSGLISCLDDCGRWACKKGMRLESTEYTVICRRQQEVEDEKWSF